jgi:hypothetical protein
MIVPGLWKGLSEWMQNMSFFREGLKEVNCRCVRELSMRTMSESIISDPASIEKGLPT